MLGVGRGLAPTALSRSLAVDLVQAYALTSIHDYPLIISRELDDPGGVALERLAPQDVAPTVILEDHGSLVRITERSDAIWLSSPYALAPEIRSGRLRELRSSRTPAPRFRMLMYSLERRTLSPAAQRLRDQFKSEIRKLAAEVGEAGDGASPG